MSSNKSWDRPWSMDEIIENSDKWNLAGDVALLNTLKAFADNLLTRTNEINNNLENLTKNLDEKSLQLNIAQNQFQGLRNTQFIESRVYEDDESLPQPESDSKPTIGDKEEDHTEDIRLAALKGLNVLDQYFDKVEVSVSDSEDEDIDLPNYILRPKDLYIDRPLPYVIGSDEWHKNWHVGLADSSSDSETEKVSDKFSESDSESEQIIQDRSQIKGTSDTSSELDFSQKIESKVPKQDFFNSSDSESSVPVQVPISNKNFAEQLAAKLGNVITKDFEEPEVNRRPIQPATTTNYGDMFFDEPPPLDEPKGLFSGGGGLFDDEDDKIESPRLSKGGGLFDDSDDEIFAKKTTQNTKTLLFNDEPPTLEEKKKPVGGVSIFGGGNLFDKKLLRRQPSSDNEEDEDKEEKKVEDEVKQKKVDLFGDDELFGGTRNEDRASIKSERIIKKVNLFDSDEEEANDLFNEDKNVTKQDQEEKKDTKLFDTDEEQKITNTTEEIPKPEKKISLFDDDDLFKDDLFSTTNTKKKFTSGLFDDVPEDNLFSTNFEEKPKTSANLFDDLVTIPDDKNSINVDTKTENKNEEPSDTFFKEATSNDSLKETENETNIPPPQPKPRLSLFDSPPPSPVDLFPKPVSSMRLFDPSPPPDDEWDTKSDNLSENEDFATDFEETTSNKPNLFSEEPPSLDFLPEPSVKNKPGKLKHALNINVGALMPGALPPKRDTNVSKTLTDDVTDASSNVPAADAKVAPSADATGTSFDDADGVEVLHSVTKDRVRVPFHRRPSTRRGRKAALKNAASDFNLEQGKEDFKDKTDTVSQKKDSLFETSEGASVKNDLLFEESKKDDFFDQRTSENDDLFNVRPQIEESEVKEASKSDDLFDVSTKTEDKPQKTTTLFDDEDDDDLFSSRKVTNQPTKVAKRSLFDDENDDDDDDIFKSFSSASAKKQDTKVATEKKIPKISSVKKLENTKSEDDPLSALLK